MAQWRLKSEQYLPQETITAMEGRLCLGFVNTFHPRYGRHVHDALSGYADLVAWNRSVGMLTEAQEQNFLQAANAHPEEALRTFERAVTLREIIYRVFSAVAAGNAPEVEDLSALHGAYAEAVGHASLSPTAREFLWEWEAKEAPGHGEELQSLLWPVALSAIELLTSAKEWGKIKECPGCGWLFLDSSKTGNRRWCSMDECGSRDKMRRQYARKRADVRSAS
ncbi:MAG TPA: ABATE domain-containing protein [Ktedonobacterales bacterium]|jgi:predicted RNA-binding Zn ribbon-like protein|nr:ABATE domain-containing protein [Ktedonobacterales bacterium]